MIVLRFLRRSTSETYRFADGVWHGPGSRRVTLTRLQEKIALRFLNSPRARLSADQIEEEITGSSNRNDPTGYRKHVYDTNAALGFDLIERKSGAVAESGGPRTRRAVYGLSEDVEVLVEKASRASEVGFSHSVAAYRKALLDHDDWFTIRPIVSSGERTKVETLYVELFLRPAENFSTMPGSMLGLLPEQETPRSTGAIHRVTAESLLARATDRTIVIGAPGTGKTTLLKWISAYLLKEQSAHQLTPIPITLGDFAADLESGQIRGLLEHGLVTLLGIREAPAHLSALTQAGEELRAIYLLDGWDEVPVKMRTIVLKHIDSVAADYPVLITSRVNAASYLTRYSGAAIFELGALADEAVAELCFKQGKAKGRLNLVPGLLHLIENNPGLWAIAGNPYLLTLLCEIAFAVPELPAATEVSPTWVLSQAISLIRSDYNANTSTAALTLRDMERITWLAHFLSFGGPKRTTFEPDSELEASQSDFLESPAGRSRFFNATGIASTSYSFVHLRMQEFLAAKWASEHDSVSPAWLERHLLSRIWREEAKFVVALELRSQDNRRALRACLRKLILRPDEAGESIRCVAGALAAAGVRDGGGSFLGMDVRVILWQRITSRSAFLAEDSQALLELDPEFMLNGLLTLENGDDILLSQLYRFLPLGLRRTSLDPRFANSPILSWMIGLPGRGFPTVEDLNALGKTVEDEHINVDERIHALRDLGSARAHSQVDRITPLLTATNEALSTAAAETLGKIGGREAAVALAQGLISVNESTVVRVPELVSSLLNSIAVTGYGAIEPHSRDLLVSYLNQAPERCENLELILNALAGTPLPEPPMRILTILEEHRVSTVSLRKAAASVLRGIYNPTLLNRSLEILATEPNQQVREHVLTAVPFVPVGFANEAFLWRLCRARSKKEASHAVLLIFRTVARYPRHPIVDELVRFVEDTLGVLAIAEQCDSLQRQMLHGLRIMSVNDRIKRALLRVLVNPNLDFGSLALTTEALAVQRITLEDMRLLRKCLRETQGFGKESAPLVAALAVTLFAHHPESAPQILHTLKRKRPVVGDLPYEALLKVAQASGHLIYEDGLVHPDGRVRRSTANA